MKIVLAPNAFKGSMTAVEAALAMERGVKASAADAEVVRVPVADGGDGLVAVLHEALGGELRSARVRDPLGRPLDAEWLWLSGQATGVIEMARASGLALLKPQECDPSKTTTYGTGALMRAALDAGAQHVIVGLGGSATTDGGVGMAAALGVRFEMKCGEALTSWAGGTLAEIARIDMTGRDPRLSSVTVEAVCDVDNPLLGMTGAAAVYGPQKGADAEMVGRLEAGLAHLASCLREQHAVDVAALAGAGAAGGLGAGLVAFAGAQLRPGVEVILDLVGLNGALDGADLVLTAEGGLDAQTAFGKAPAGVARRARARSIPCVAIAGGIAPPIASLHELGLDAAFSLCNRPLALQEAIERGPELLALASEQVVRCIAAARRNCTT